MTNNHKGGNNVIVMAPPSTVTAPKVVVKPTQAALKAKRNEVRRKSHILSLKDIKAITPAREEIDHVADLIDMMSTMRPSRTQANSKYYKEWLAKWIEPVFGEHDGAFNYVHIVTTDGEALTKDNMPRVSYMSHHDTVHTRGGAQGKRMGFFFMDAGNDHDDNLIMCVNNPQKEFEIAQVMEKRWDSVQKCMIDVKVMKNVETEESKTALHSNCLGADCTVGVWIMLKMIQADIPGVYIVHNDEEVGCVGSKRIVSEYHRIRKEAEALGPDTDDNSEVESGYSTLTFEQKHALHPYSFWIEYVDIAMSFDRWGTSSIITHQSGSRTCSAAFADSLSALLSPMMMEYAYPQLAKDDGGSYTDSNSYKSVIKECTNICVGYTNQHGADESQDLTFAATLAYTLCEVGEKINDPAVVVAERDYTVEERKSYGYGGNVGAYTGHSAGAYKGYGSALKDYADHTPKNKDVGKYDPTKKNYSDIFEEDYWWKTHSDSLKEEEAKLDAKDAAAMKQIDKLYSMGIGDDDEDADFKFFDPSVEIVKGMTKEEEFTYWEFVDLMEQHPEHSAYFMMSKAKVSIIEFSLYMHDIKTKGKSL